ncbi:hypothetical protein EON65_38070 [archaeon]|nr:MAG: hypothetical protein EON65_38070 [archaeon]
MMGTLIKLIIWYIYIKLTIEFEKVREKALEFWEKGDPEAPWIPYIESDFKFTLPQTYTPKTAKERRGPDFVKAGTHWKVPK